MNSLEFDYLKNNGFQSEGADKVVAYVVKDGEIVKDGFKDARQMAYIKARFGEDFLKYVTDMRIEVKFVGSDYDVVLEWASVNGYGDHVTGESFVGGEDVYDLISQAIVLARIGTFR